MVQQQDVQSGQGAGAAPPFELPADPQEWLDAALSAAQAYGPNLLIALLILVAGFWIAGRAGRLTDAALSRTGRVDETLRGFLRSLVRYAIVAVVLVTVLNRLGVQTASLIALLGAASIAVGLALQGVLSNLAAGVMLLLFRPIKIGDYVLVGGEGGTVKSLGLFNTELATIDNVQIIVPNGSVWGQTITNFSAYDTRRIDLVIGVSYEDDPEKAVAVLKSVVEADERVMAEPAPVVAVGALGESSVDILVRPWCKASDYWALRWDLLKTIKRRLDEEGISIPYPHRKVELLSLDALKKD